MARPADVVWYDAADQIPSMVCEVLLSDGAVRDARCVCGNWKTLGGVALDPISWRPIRFSVLTSAVHDNDLP